MRVEFIITIPLCVTFFICFWIRFQRNFSFPISANFSIQTLFLNFSKTLFDLRSLCNRFLRCIYLTADARLKKITFQSALVSLFYFCMLETVTNLLFLHVINSITNFLSNTPQTLKKIFTAH